MKSFLSVLLTLALLAALLTGCAAEPPATPQDDARADPAQPSAPAEPLPADPEPSETDDTPPEAAPQDEPAVILYLPTAQADGLEEVEESVQTTPQGIVDALIAHGALPENTVVNNFLADDEAKTIRLDLSGEFLTALSSTGTAGEAMLLGSLVNTMLAAYEADAITLTCDGAVMETGHNVYDMPLTWMEF